MQDKNGKELKVGDIVNVPARIIAIDDDTTDTYRVELETLEVPDTAEGAEDGNTGDSLWVNNRQVEFKEEGKPDEDETPDEEGEGGDEEG
jgi:hypothetical protein